MHSITVALAFSACICHGSLFEKSAQDIELRAKSRAFKALRLSHTSRNHQGSSFASDPVSNRRTPAQVHHLHALTAMLLAPSQSTSSVSLDLRLRSHAYDHMTRVDRLLMSANAESISSQNTPQVVNRTLVSDLSLTTNPGFEKENELKMMDVSNASVQQLGLAGLAGSAAAATALSTAGGVCVGGGCAVAGSVAAGASATAVGTGVAAGAAGAATGIAGLQSILVGGAIALASITNLITGSPGDLGAMVASSTPMEVAMESRRPTVVEFYRQECTFCNEAAPRLVSVEKSAKENGINWVMIDTDSDQMTNEYITKYNLYYLPHFEFLGADGERAVNPEEGGPVNIQSIAERVSMLQRYGYWTSEQKGTGASSSLFPSDVNRPGQLSSEETARTYSSLKKQPELSKKYW